MPCAAGFCALCPLQAPVPPLRPFALRIRKSTRPARKALTRAHRDALRRGAGSVVPERRNPGNSVSFPARPSEPSRSFPPFAQRALQARRGAFALLRYPLPHGAGRAVPQACSVRRIAEDKTKGQTFPPARGVFDGGNQSPSGRARSCRSFSCASACTSSGKSLSTLFARNRYCHRSSCRASLTTAS